MVQQEDLVQRVSQGFQSHVPAGRLQLAFPYRNAMPPHVCQFLLHPLVPLLITYYLCMPVLGSRLGHYKQPAPLVPMPEAPVHKDARPVFPQHYVRFPRQSRMVEPISKATTPQEFAHQHFRLRILSLYRSHAPVPLFRSQFVHSAMGECFSLSGLLFQFVQGCVREGVRCQEVNGLVFIKFLAEKFQFECCIVISLLYLFREDNYRCHHTILVFWFHLVALHYRHLAQQ